MFKKKELTRLGDILVSKGLITPEQLASAIQEQSKRKLLLDPADTTAKVTPIGEILIELGFIDRLQLKRGLNWQQRLRHASIAMALCAPFMMFAPSIARAAPIVIEAENYTTMQGVVTENTSDVGGGSNIGSFTAGEWTTYKIDLPSSGNYKITYRIATAYTGSKLVLKSDKDVELAPALDIPKTGGWQAWRDIEQTVKLEKGAQTLKIYAQAGGFNVNWFKLESLEPVPEPVSKLIEAESYSSMSGVVPETTGDIGGGKNLGYIGTGDWMNYENADLIIPQTGTYKISYRVANLTDGSVLQLKNIVTGATLDTVPVPKTGGWQTWATVERIVTLEQGLTKLQVYAQNGSFNFNWFKVESVDAPQIVTPSQVVPPSIATPETIFPVVIQAESFSEMVGVKTEPTSDEGGGASVGYIDVGDSMSYANTLVRAPYTGKYKVSYRVASLNGGASFALNEYGTNITIGTVDVPKTGGWQQWATVETEVTLTEGEHKFSVLAKKAGANINWIKIEPLGTPMPLTIQAEDYSAMSGIQNETAADVGGGKNAGNINTGDWMEYKNVEVLIPATASYKVSYRVASLNAGGKFNFHEAGGSAVFDTVTVPVTGGWQKWTTVERVVTLPAGKHYFGVKALLGGFNVNWIKIEPADSSSTTSTNPPSATNSSSSSSSAAAVVSSSSSSKPAVSSSSWSSASSAASNGQHVAGPVGISWTAPNKRENGNFLDVTELGGYEIRYKKTTDTAFTYISINDAWTTSYNFPWLEGDYIFQIAAFDKNGVYSPFVDILRQ